MTPTDIDTNAPLIYMWSIYDGAKLVGQYIGKSKHGAGRPLKHYRRNVTNLISGKPYRKKNVNGYRRIHRALADAVLAGRKIELCFVVNIGEGESIDAVERLMIAKYKTAGSEKWQLNGI